MPKLKVELVLIVSELENEQTRTQHRYLTSKVKTAQKLINEYIRTRFPKEHKSVRIKVPENKMLKTLLL